MTTFEKLAIRLKKDLDISAKNYRRMYVGYWQRSSGAFVWCATTDRDKDEHTGHYDIGSTFSATLLLRENNPLIISRDGEILPDN